MPIFFDVVMDKKRPVGRPRMGNVKLQFSLSQDAARIIRAAAKRHKLSRSAFIDLLVRYGELPETVIRAYKPENE